MEWSLLIIFLILVSQSTSGQLLSESCIRCMEWMCPEIVFGQWPLCLGCAVLCMPWPIARPIATPPLQPMTINGALVNRYKLLEQ